MLCFTTYCHQKKPTNRLTRIPKTSSFAVFPLFPLFSSNVRYQLICPKFSTTYNEQYGYSCNVKAAPWKQFYPWILFSPPPIFSESYNNAHAPNIRRGDGTFVYLSVLSYWSILSTKESLTESFSAWPGLVIWFTLIYLKHGCILCGSSVNS